MNELEKYAKDIASKYKLRYNPDDTIEALPEQLEVLKKALSEITNSGLEIECSEILYQKLDKVYFIMVDF